MLENLIGKTLDEKYEIQKLLGEGQTTLVFEAYARYLEHQVAVKIIKPEYTSSDAIIETFVKKAQLLNRLKSPYILSVYDLGEYSTEDRNLPYLVTELTVGGTLANRLESGNLTLNELEHILEQVRKALDYALSQNVLHSGLKPHKILLDEQGDVRLSDFVPAQLVQTATGIIARISMPTSADIPSEQPSGEQVSLFSGVCDLSLAFHESTLMARKRLSSWRRRTLGIVASLILLVTITWLILPGTEPLLPGNRKEVMDIVSSSPLALSAVTATLTSSPSFTSTPTPSVTATLTPSPSFTPTPTPSATPTPIPSPIPYLIVSVERLFIYTGSGEVYEVRRGDQLPLRGCSEDGMWWQVDYLGREGWIHAQSTGASIDPCALGVIRSAPKPTDTPTPAETETPSLPGPNTRISLQNPGFRDIEANSIPGWEWWAYDNYSGGDYDPDTSFDMPLLKQADDPVRMINGPTLQIDAAGHLKFKAHVFQSVGVPPTVTVRFRVLAGAYADKGGIKLAAGVDPDGGNDCSNARWGDMLTINQSNGAVQLVAPDVTVGRAGRVTVCLYAEALYAARSNAAFFDDAELIGNPE